METMTMGHIMVLHIMALLDGDCSCKLLVKANGDVYY